MGRLGNEDSSEEDPQCKAGGYWYLLPHDGRCRRAPQLRAIGGPISRAALRLETGRATQWHLLPNRACLTDANANSQFWTRMRRVSWPGRLDGANV